MLGNVIEEEDELAKGSAEEAKTKEHQLTRLPRNPSCEVCLGAKALRKPKLEIVVVLEPDTATGKAPTRFGDQVAADQLIKNDGEKEEAGIPDDTVALVMLDRSTQWIAVYPKATKTAEHTMEAFQHIAGKKDTTASFYSDNAPELAKAARKCNGD